MFEVNRMLFVPLEDRIVRLGVLLFVSVLLFCPSFWCVSMVCEVH